MLNLTKTVSRWANLMDLSLAFVDICWAFGVCELPRLLRTSLACLGDCSTAHVKDAAPWLSAARGHSLEELQSGIFATNAAQIIWLIWMFRFEFRLNMVKPSCSYCAQVWWEQRWCHGPSTVVCWNVVASFEGGLSHHTASPCCVVASAKITTDQKFEACRKQLRLIGLVASIDPERHWAVKFAILQSSYILTVQWRNEHKWPMIATVMGFGKSYWCRCSGDLWCASPEVPTCCGS